LQQIRLVVGHAPRDSSRLPVSSLTRQW
jgi:hypothetical protein